MAKTRTPRKAKGLGDTIEQITEATGIKKLVKFVAGEDCGCDERKKKLNEWFPYRQPECLTEEEYNWLTETRILEKDTFKWPKQMRGEVLTLSERQWSWLLEGLDIERMKGHKPLQFSSTY